MMNDLIKKELQHKSMNLLLNLRHILQGKLYPVLGKRLSKKVAIFITKLIEAPIKMILY